MNKKLLYKLKLNPDTGEWEMLTEEVLISNQLYIEAANRMEEIRENLIEDALAQSDWSESEEILTWIRKLDKNKKRK